MFETYPIPTSFSSFPPSHLLFPTNRSPLPCNNLLNSCSSLADLCRIHAALLTRGLASRLSIATKLIYLAAALSPTMSYARNIFDEIPHRDSFLWNTLIRGYATAGPCQEVPLLYRDMHRSGLTPDHFTFPFVIRSCSVVSAFGEAKQAHCNIVKNRFDSDVFAQSSLIAMYFQGGEISDAEAVFAEMEERSVVSWTAMIAGYSQNCFFGKSLGVFDRMVRAGARPNEVTLASVLPACNEVKFSDLGKSIHGFVIKAGLDSHVSLTNAIIAMYGRCGSTQSANYMFDRMPQRSLVSWNTMIAVYEQNNDGDAAIRVFRRLMEEKIGVDCVTLLSVISACTNTGNLEMGRSVHDLARNRGLEIDPRIGNALLDMYGKCGKIDSARDLFRKLLPLNSVISWSSMIGAYASHGYAEEALKLFSEMKGEQVTPNKATFTSVLTACSHSGRVEEGLRCFDEMKRDYGPAVEHCACVVDLLGRAGRIGEAFEFVRRMEVKPDRAVWGALLGACRMHGNVEMAERVVEDLLRVEPGDATIWVLMANLYAEAGRWEDAARMRRGMRERVMMKAPGFSLV